MSERRISTPVVLALASAMVCIGVIAVVVTKGDGEAADVESPRERTSIPVDTRTPEAAAETFLDAWRKREHELAADLSIGEAREVVLARKEEDEELAPDEREIKEQVWDQMAEGRLRLRIAESETHGPNRITLRGVAVGDFLGRPYEREIEFGLERISGEWKVERMRLGEILSETPDALTLPPERHDPVGKEPGQLEYRGEDVP